MSNPQKRPVTVEDLLRLKRAERPSPEFWTRFESELRAKQLAAIVEKRPWWHGLSLAGLARHRVSLGATAVLALSVFSVVEYRSRTEKGSFAVSSDLASASPVAGLAAGIPATPSLAMASPEAAAPVAVNLALPLSGESYAGSENFAVATETSELSDVDSAGKMHEVSSGWTLVADDAGMREFSTVGRLLTENLASAKEAHPELASRFFAVSGFEKRGLPATRQSVDPLAQMRNPSELHRERLLASAASASLSSSPRTSDRPARRLSDRHLTEDVVSRFDARGSKFSLKF